MVQANYSRTSADNEGHPVTFRKIDCALLKYNRDYVTNSALSNS